MFVAETGLKACFFFSFDPCLARFSLWLFHLFSIKAGFIFRLLFYTSCSVTGSTGLIKSFLPRKNIRTSAPRSLSGLGFLHLIHKWHRHLCFLCDKLPYRENRGLSRAALVRKNFKENFKATVTLISAGSCESLSSVKKVTYMVLTSESSFSWSLMRFKHR